MFGSQVRYFCYLQISYFTIVNSGGMNACYYPTYYSLTCDFGLCFCWDLQVNAYQDSGIKLGVFKSLNESLTRVAVYVSLLALYCLGGSKVKAVRTLSWNIYSYIFFNWILCMYLMTVLRKGLFSHAILLFVIDMVLSRNLDLYMFVGVSIHKYISGFYLLD